MLRKHMERLIGQVWRDESATLKGRVKEWKVSW